MRGEVLLAGAPAPEPLPVHDFGEADLWDQLPSDLPELLALVPRAELYLQDEMQVTFHPTLTRVWSHKGRRGQRLVEAPLDNRHPSMALAWSTGAMAGRVAGSRKARTADMFCEQVRAAVARSEQRGRVAIVMADNLKTHTAAGPLLVREPGSSNCKSICAWCIRLPMILTLTGTPWLWRISRRIVTHKHHRSTFELLLADVQQHFQALAQTPAEVLGHMGSPFAPDKDQDAPLSLAQAA